MNLFFTQSLINLAHPLNILFLIVGVGAGIIVGGLTATMAIALLVPFTFTMSAIHGLVLLGGIYCGAIYGGCFSAILINTPGTPSAIATTFDGYPMAKKGDAYKAIVTATISSVIGGLIGVAFLLFLSPPLSKASLKFGPPEFFWLTAFGLTIIATLASKSILKGLIGGAFGLLISSIGIAPIEGSVRFTFGIVSLQDGIGLIPALIGFFCIPEVLAMIEKRGQQYSIIPYREQRKVVLTVTLKLLKRPFLLILSFTRTERNVILGKLSRKHIIIVISVLLIAAWGFFINIFGFVVSSILFFSLINTILDKRQRGFLPVLKKVGIITVVVGAFYFFFATLLLVPFPERIPFLAAWPKKPYSPNNVSPNMFRLLLNEPSFRDRCPAEAFQHRIFNRSVCGSLLSPFCVITNRHLNGRKSIIVTPVIPRS